jgi:hypothetical protein
MERPHTRLSQSASALVLFPIVGLLGGILLGVIRAQIMRGDPFANLVRVVEGGFLGSVFGAGAAIVFGILERKSLTSVKKMMGFVLAVAVVLWAVVTLVRDLVASGVL